MLLTTKGLESRIPGIWIKDRQIIGYIYLNEPDRKVQVTNKVTNYGEWYHVELKHQQINGTISKFTIKVNETVPVEGFLKTPPFQYEDVSWYQSWTTNSAGDEVDIKNVRF